VAESLGVKLNTIYIDRNNPQDQETLKKLNPLCQVPVFVGSDGFLLTECTAILLYGALTCPPPLLTRSPMTV